MALCMFLGTNLVNPIVAPEEMPFLNVLKNGSSWLVAGGSGVGANMQVDANGYPTTMTLSDATVATSFTIQMFFGLSTAPGASGPYSAGNYVLLYDGAGTITLAGDATTLVSTAAGRQVWTVVPASFLSVVITAITGGNNLRNIRIVYSPDSTGAIIGVNETALNNGEIFGPDFIAKVQSFKAFRFMDWQQTLNSITQNWSDRTVPSFYRWNRQPGNSANEPQADTNSVGIPVEVMCALCNKLNAHPWFNMPIQATDDYITQFATLAHSLLKPNLKAYIEYSNEPWNQAWSAANTTYLIGKGSANFPSAPNNFSFQLDWCIARAIQMRVLWKAAWPDPARVIGVLGGQFGFEARNSFIMGFTASTDGGNGTLFSGTAAANVDAFTTAPYFPIDSPSRMPIAWTADMDGGLDRCFSELIAGTVPAASQGTTAGGPAAFTVSISGVSSAPANGTTIAVTLNVGASSGATLAVSGGPALVMTDFYGNAQTFPAGLLTLGFTNSTAVLLKFTGGSGNFPVGAIVTGGTSGATGSITAINQNGGVGSMNLSGTTGTFQNAETITGSGVSATINAAPSGGAVSPAQWRNVNGGYAGGKLKQVTDQYSSNFSNAASFNLPLLGYEGGQTFVPEGITDIMLNYDIIINRSPRMKLVYFSYLSTVKTITGNSLFNHYNDILHPTNFGFWGALESAIQPTSPKYFALMDALVCDQAVLLGQTCT